MPEYLAFPFGLRAGRAATVDAETHVRQVIEVVLFTQPGQRVNRPTFGAGADQLVFEPDNDALTTAVKHLVQAALQQAAQGLYQVRDLQVSAEGATLSVTVTYVDNLSPAPKSLTLERAR